MKALIVVLLITLVIITRNLYIEYEGYQKRIRCAEHYTKFAPSQFINKCFDTQGNFFIPKS